MEKKLRASISGTKVGLDYIELTVHLIIDYVFIILLLRFRFHLRKHEQIMYEWSKYSGNIISCYSQQ